MSIFVTSSRLLTRHGSGIEELADLKGRRVAVTAGTTSERSLLLHAEATGTRFDILKVKDHGDGFNSVQEGRAAAFLMDEAMLYGLRAKADRPGDWRVVGCDPEGLDLQFERTGLRLPFPQRVAQPGVLRAVLKQMAEQARAA